MATNMQTIFKLTEVVRTTHTSFLVKRDMYDYLGSAIGAMASVASQVINSNMASQMKADDINFNREQAEINRQFNREERGWAQQFNAEQAQLARQFAFDSQNFFTDKQNHWNEQMYQKYSSPQARVSQMRDAGLNPAMSMGQMSGIANMSGASAPQSAVASTTPTSGIPATYKSTLSPINPDVFKTFADLQKTISETKLNEEEIKRRESFNKFAEQIYSLDIDIKKSDLSKVYQEIQESKTRIQEYQANVAKLLQETAKLSAEEKYQLIQNAYADETFKSSLEKLKKDMQWTNNQINYFKARLPFELKLLSAQEEDTKAAAQLKRDQSVLTDFEISESHQRFMLLNSQTFGQNQLNDITALYGAPTAKEALEDAKYKNSRTYRWLTGAASAAGTFRDAMISAMLAKGMKKSSPTNFSGYGM